MAHNNQGYFLDDATYSVVCPHFMVYHGFIDLALEFRIQ